VIQEESAIYRVIQEESAIYRVIQEESAILWEMIVCVKQDRSSL